MIFFSSKNQPTNLKKNERENKSKDVVTKSGRTNVRTVVEFSGTGVR